MTSTPASDDQVIEHEEVRIGVHSSVIFALGENLISDEVQALIELIKNSYDANATFVNIVVSTSEPPPYSAQPDESLGYVSIEDDGEGMDDVGIKRGWLTISNSVKRERKQNPISPAERTPLGDKGLGRLGAQRLGGNLEMWTRSRHSSQEYHVAIAWNDFRQKELIADVSITIDTTSKPTVFYGSKTGTRLIISGLGEGAKESWRDALKEGRLRDQLSEMLSPYREVKGFRVIINIDGQRLNLAEVTDKLRRTAQLHYDISFRERVGDGKKVFCSTGKAKLDYFRPQGREEVDKWNRAISADGGEGLFYFLKYDYQPRTASRYFFERVLDGDGKPSNEWFVTFRYEREFEDFPELALLDYGQAADPGPFTGQLDSFNLSTAALKGQSVFDSSAEYKKYVESIRGIRVYRDGFGIRTDKDWLKLSARSTSGPSVYGLRIGNVMGYIAISAKYNDVLQEKTDREGFNETPYYINFRLILDDWVGFTDRVQEFMKRGATAYLRRIDLPPVTVPHESPEAISRHMSQTLANAQKHTGPLQGVVQEMDKAISHAQRTLVEAPGLPAHSTSDKKQLSLMLTHVPQTDIQAIESAVANIQTKLNEGRQQVENVAKYLKDAADNAALGEVLSEKIEILNNQLAETYETVSLGLTAELIAHDMHMVTDKLSSETQRVRKYLKKKQLDDVEINRYLSNIDSSINALHKQLSRLTPALRFMREKKEDIDLPQFFVEQEEYFRPRLEKYSIKMELKSTRADNFHVHMNRGKLTQVIDNLLLNSEYWVREELRLGRIKEGVIQVELVKPYVRICDNGPGVESSVEGVLFEPFTTTKPKQQGRGLGLFIVQQLLDPEGCHIDLAPDLNQRRRRYVFEIDLSNVLVDKN